jgi:hypothetical protein
MLEIEIAEEESCVLGPFLPAIEGCYLKSASPFNQSIMSLESPRSSKLSECLCAKISEVQAPMSSALVLEPGLQFIIQLILIWAFKINFPPAPHSSPLCWEAPSNQATALSRVMCCGCLTGLNLKVLAEKVISETMMEVMS